jgi:hypothetical protein
LSYRNRKCFVDVSCFETVDRDVVFPGAHLKGEKLIRTVDDSIWTFIGCLERGFSCIGSDKHELCLGQNVWHVDFDGTMGAGGDRLEVTDLLTELSEMLVLVRCLWSAVRDEIPWYRQGGPVDQLCRRRVQVLLRGCAVSKEYPWEFTDPMGTGETGLERGFEGTMQTFDEPVSLGVVGRRGV